jgi:hypothetical protein
MAAIEIKQKAHRLFGALSMWWSWRDLNSRPDKTLYAFYMLSSNLIFERQQALLRTDCHLIF